MKIYNKIRNHFKSYAVKRRSFVNRYFGSLTILIFAVLLVDWLKDIEGARAYSIVLASVIISAIHGGLGPSIMTSFLGALILDYAFEEPVNQAFTSFSSYIRVFVFSTMSLFASIVIDLLKESLLETERLKVKSENANLAKDNLMAVVAHDLRNPLSIIMGFSEILEDKGQKNQEYYNCLDVIKRNCSTGLELINDLQELSSIDNPEYKLDLSELSLNALLDDVISSSQSLASKKNIRVDFVAIPEEVFLKGDQRLLRRVFQNLLDNAIKYSPLDANIEITIEENLKHAFVAFIDCGEGIPESEHNKIFTPFYRTKIKPTGGESSTGLGLATVSAILNAHKASLELKSKPGEGSSFKVCLQKDIGCTNHFSAE